MMIVWVLIGALAGRPVIVDNIWSATDCQTLARELSKSGGNFGTTEFRCYPVKKVAFHN